MVQALINLSENSNRVLNIIKAKYDVVVQIARERGYNDVLEALEEEIKVKDFIL